MADINRTVEIIFGIRDDASSTLGDIRSNIDSFSNNVTGPLSDIGDDALKAETAVLGLGVALLGVAVNEAATFSTSMREIGTLFNATPAEVQALGDEVRTFGRDSVFSFGDTTEALYNMISATGDVEHSVDGLRQSQELSIVTNSSLNTSVGAITTVLNSYNLGMDSAKGVSESLFVTVQGGKTTLDELEANIGKVAATASAAGVPFDDLSAAIATITAGGVVTAEAMTQLKAIIAELADPSAALSAAMGGLSLEADGLKPIMDALQVSTGGNFTEMSKLFSSIESTNAALVLAGPGSDLFAKSLENMGNKANVVSDNVALLEHELKFVTQNMRNNLNDSLIEIGDNLKGGWTDIIASLGALFKGTSIALDDGTFDPVFTALNDFQSAITTYISGIAKVLPDALKDVDFSELVGSFRELGGSLGGIFDGLDLTKTEDLTKAIQFMVDGLSGLTQTVTGITTSWGPALQTIIGLVGTFNGAKTDTRNFAGELLGLSQQFEAFKGILTGVVAPAGSVAATLASFVGANYLAQIATGTSLVSTAIPILSTALRAVPWALFALSVLDAAKAVYSGEKSSLGGALDYLFEKFKGYDSFDDYLQNVDWLEAKSRNATIASLELEVNIQKLKNATGDATINSGNYNDKLTEFIISTNAAAYEAKEFGANIGEPLTAISTLSEALKLSKEVADADKDSFEALGKKLKNVGLNTQEATTYLDLLSDSSENAADKATQFATAVEKGASELELDTLSMQLYGNTAGKSAEQINSLVDAAWSSFEPFKGIEKVYGAATEATDDYGHALVDAQEPIVELDKKVGDLTETEKLAIENTHDMEITLVEIASNEKIAEAKAVTDLHEKMLELATDERIAAMKFTADIEVANIQAQAQEVVAAYDTIARAIGSTEETVRSLWDLYGEKMGWSGADSIRDAAQAAEERVNRQMDMQEALNEAQIAYWDAQVKALAKETTVTIESSGLDSNIEAFMFEILKRIQLKVAGDRTAFLLGAG